MLSTFFMHLAALLRQAFLPLLVIIFEPATAAAVPTARPIPMLVSMPVLFDDIIINYPSNQNYSLLFCLDGEIKQLPIIFKEVI